MIFSAKSAGAVRQHGLSDACSNHSYYRKLKAEHDAMDHSRPTEKTNKALEATRTYISGSGDPSDLSWRSRIARKTPEMLVDYVEFVSINVFWRTAN